MAQAVLVDITVATVAITRVTTRVEVEAMEEMVMTVMVMVSVFISFANLNYLLCSSRG